MPSEPIFGWREPLRRLNSATPQAPASDEAARGRLEGRVPRFNPDELSGACYARFGHWHLYGEERLAGNEAALWLAAESLTVEHAGEPHSPYEVEAVTGK